MPSINRRFAFRWILRAMAVLLGGIVLSALVPGCGVGYVVRSAYFQGELMTSRTPVEEVLASDRLSVEQRDRLLQVADIKRFGEEIGLKPTKNYDTIAIDWDRTIWNLTACQPLAFKPKTWRFPIVGRVPYLGFFRRADADRWKERLETQGYEVYLRTAGAYSTLGWFRDPILLPMLDWNAFQLADTVLHELVHATLWIKGSVKFNESFANFLGEEAAFRYLKERFGVESPVYIQAVQSKEDLDRWRGLLRQLYADLDTVYRDETLQVAQKQERKTTLFSGLEQRVIEAGFHNPARFVATANKQPWNNARLMQYRTYNHNRDRFQALLDGESGDLNQFIKRIQTLTHKSNDPFSALENAVKPARTGHVR